MCHARLLCNMRCQVKLAGCKFCPSFYWPLMPAQHFLPVISYYFNAIARNVHVNQIFNAPWHETLDLSAQMFHISTSPAALWGKSLKSSASLSAAYGRKRCEEELQSVFRLEKQQLRCKAQLAFFMHLQVVCSTSAMCLSILVFFSQKSINITLDSKCRLFQNLHGSLGE